MPNSAPIRFPASHSRSPGIYNDVYASGSDSSPPAASETMKPRLFRILGLLRTPAAIVFGTVLLASSALAQTRPAAPESPYGGTTVEEIIARVNDQIITRSDYDRAMKEMDASRASRAVPCKRFQRVTATFCAA